MKVLVADDDLVSRYTLENALIEWGYDVITACDGVEAWQLLQSNDAPKLAVIDWMMPGMDGPEVCRKLREIADSQPTYAILLTVKDHREDIVAGLQAGADDYVTKSSDLSELRERVQVGIRILELQRKLASRVRELEDAFLQIRQREEALAAQGERLAITLGSIGDGVITTDADGRVDLINKVAQTLTGWTEEEAVGKPLGEILHLIDGNTMKRHANPLEEMLKTDGIIAPTDDSVLISRDATKRIVTNSEAPIRDADGNIVGVVLVFHDVTEKRRLEEEERLAKIQKLESIGILAGGIAHDFNNILTVVLGNISLARTYTDTGELSKRLVEAEKATLQAQGLTQQLLTFSRASAPIKEIVCIAEQLKNSAVFSSRGSNVKCEFFIPEDLWLVEADKGQMDQVINNLIINADQAMPEGGIIRILAENAVVEAENALILDDGEYVKISIADSGVGISEENLQHIFDPYFSTKDGSNGLGLATTYSIIRKHSGHIAVESQEGSGTTFYIYLPASPEKAMLAKGKAKEKQGGLVSGKGKILIMDDEEPIRKIVSIMLSKIGYSVCAAMDGAETIEMYRDARNAGQPFDAVIMDLTIPGGMGGMEAIQELMKISGEVKAIVSSGYSNDPAIADFRKHGFRGAITKPYRIEKLSEVLHNIITGQAADHEP